MVRCSWKAVCYFKTDLFKRIFRELSSTVVIEKQPSAIVKRNVEKYAVPAAVSQGGFFRSTENNSRLVGDQYDRKGGEVEDEQESRGLKSSPSEKIFRTRPAINRMTYYYELCNLGLTRKKCATPLKIDMSRTRSIQKHDHEFYISTSG